MEKTFLLLDNNLFCLLVRVSSEPAVLDGSFIRICSCHWGLAWCVEHILTSCNYVQCIPILIHLFRLAKMSWGLLWTLFWPKMHSICIFFCCWPYHFLPQGLNLLQAKRVSFEILKCWKIYWHYILIMTWNNMLSYILDIVILSCPFLGLKAALQYSDVIIWTYWTVSTSSFCPLLMII